MSEVKSRVFEITSQEPYVTEEKCRVAILSHKTIKQALYICHNKDVYTEKTVNKEKQRLKKKYDDILAENGEEFSNLVKDGVNSWNDYYNKYHVEEIGKVKPKHWHCYIRFDCPMGLNTIAKWFDTAAQNVEAKKGAGAFVDCLEYAVHDSENAKADGKYPYSWDEATAFGMSVDDAKEMVHDKQIRRLKYGKDLSPKEALRMRILKEGMTLKEAYDKYPLEFAEDRNTLVGLRTEYLAHCDKVPDTRYNFFITGSGGVGKDTVGRGLARQFYPDREDEEIFHIVKDINVPFEGYDGQPVIIWEDVRSLSLISKFGRDGIFRLFDINPSRGRYNIKYGSVPLTNTINILTSVEGYVSFLNNLAGEYIDKDGNKRQAEDKNQAYRRFPFIIPITMDYMDILVQQAYLSGDTNYQEYMQYNRTRGNLARLIFDKRVLALPEEDKKKMKSMIEQRFLDSPAKSFMDLMENNKGLLDKAMDSLNDIMEEMFGDLEEPARKIVENPTCCKECPGYHNCEDWKWQYCTQPFRDEKCPFVYDQLTIGNYGDAPIL